MFKYNQSSLSFYLQRISSFQHLTKYIFIILQSRHLAHAHSMKTPYGTYFKVNDGNNINKNLWSTFYIYRAVRYFNEYIYDTISLQL